MRAMMVVGVVALAETVPAHPVRERVRRTLLKVPRATRAPREHARQRFPAPLQPGHLFPESSDLALLLDDHAPLPSDSPPLLRRLLLHLRHLPPLLTHLLLQLHDILSQTTDLLLLLADHVPLLLDRFRLL
ncbi:hypothetical protein T484DRAFT_1960896 [Baffinella frigidus]|nr:hypothetical protein T484DRAFT_1960896 [Cryptophyta sp. CCMP2293]